MKYGKSAGFACVMMIAGCTATGGSDINAGSLLTEQPQAVSFEQLAQDVSASATKEASAPECQTLRTNYFAALEDISTSNNSGDGLTSALGGVRALNQSTSRTAGSVGRLGSRVGVDTSGAASGIGRGLGAINETAAIAGDLASVGNLFGLGRNNSYVLKSPVLSS